MLTLYSENYLNGPFLVKYRAPSLYAFYRRNMGNCKGKITNLFLNDGKVQSQLTPCTNSSHITKKKLLAEEKDLIVEKLKS